MGFLRIHLRDARPLEQGIVKKKVRFIWRCGPDGTDRQQTLG